MVWISQLPKEVQESIKEGLESLGITDDDLDLAMDSKLTDIDYLAEEW